MHTPTPPNSETGVSQGPLLCLQRLKMRLTDSFTPKLVPFLHLPLLHPPYPSLQAVLRKTQTRPLANYAAK